MALPDVEYFNAFGQQALGFIGRVFINVSYIVACLVCYKLLNLFGLLVDMVRDGACLKSISFTKISLFV